MEKLAQITRKHPILWVSCSIWVGVFSSAIFLALGLVGYGMEVFAAISPFMLILSPLPAVSLIWHSKASVLVRVAGAAAAYFALFSVALSLAALVPLMVYAISML